MIILKLITYENRFTYTAKQTLIFSELFKMRWEDDTFGQTHKSLLLPISMSFTILKWFYSAYGASGWIYNTLY